MLDNIEGTLISFLIQFASTHPWVMSLLLVMAGLRSLFKPTMTYLHQVAASTNSPKLEGELESFEKGKVYASIIFLLDFFTSIKLIPPSQPVPIPAPSNPPVNPQ